MALRRLTYVFVVLCLLPITGVSVRAAEIGCFSRYGFTPDGKRDDTERIAEETARKLWPSGFRPAPGMCQWAFLHGTISRGDYDRVLAFYRQNHQVLNVFELSSPGGDVLEAMKIGKLMRKFLITAWAPYSILLENGGEYWFGQACQGPGCACASACALIWFGAVDRNGRVGLHRPRIDDPEFKVLPPAEATKVYRRTLDEIGKYLDEMEAPRSMIDAMVATNSADIRWVDAEKDDLKRPPSIAEWADAACGYIPNEEKNATGELSMKEINSTLSPRDAVLLKLLREKDTKHSQCWMALRFSQVEQLPSP
jgi:hypothetical protein